MKVTKYTIKGPKLKVAVVADLHGQPTEELYEALKEEKPDVILCPGDLATVGEYYDRLIDPDRREKRLKTQDGALSFLSRAVNIAPVFYSRGNHEWGIDDVYRNAVKATGAVLLENGWVKFRDIWIGGQNSARCGAVYRDGKEITGKNRKPDIEWLKESPCGYRLLMCHQPEYKDIVESYVNLIVSGHTHGAQIRLFGHGLFAPDQGFFPKYSKGQYGNMIVSAGLTNTTWVPRLFNPTELVVIEMSEEAL